MTRAGAHIRAIADRLDEALSRRFETNAEAARDLSINRQTLANWRSGTSEVPATMLGEIAQACGVSTDWLVFGAETTPQSLDATQPPPTQDFAALARLVTVIERTAQISGLAISAGELVAEAAIQVDIVRELARDPRDQDTVMRTIATQIVRARQRAPSRVSAA